LSSTGTNPNQVASVFHPTDDSFVCTLTLS
jgi:hypothetical protein